MKTRNKLRISRGEDRELKKQRKAIVEGIIILVIMIIGVLVLLYPSIVD